MVWLSLLLCCCMRGSSMHRRTFGLTGSTREGSASLAQRDSEFIVMVNQSDLLMSPFLFLLFS